MASGISPFLGKMSEPKPEECATGEQASNIRHHLAVLGKATEELQMQLARFAEKLGPVLRPEPVGGLNPVSPAPKEALCPVASDLRRACEQLDETAAQIRFLAANVDL